MKELVDIVDFQKWRHLFSPPSPKVYEDEVRSFYTGMFVVDEKTLCLKVNGNDFVLDEDTLGEILEVPTDGLGTVEGTASSAFKKLIVKREDTLSGERVYKKALKPKYQLMFEMVNKVLLPRSERRSITSIADLVLIEALASYTSTSLPRLMIEHMMKVANFEDGNHDLLYGFLLTKVFEHFDVPLGKATMEITKQMFTMRTLEECECLLKKGGVGNNSTISQLIEAQESATAEIKRLQAKNATL